VKSSLGHKIQPHWHFVTDCN